MRILLADDSPHAQRMGERILREEGFDVVSVTDGETALLRMADVDPDLVIADIFLPKRSGYDLCRFVKTTPKHGHVRVVLTAGLLEPFDEEQARGVHFDAVLKKPFEASAMLELVKPLVAAADAQRQNQTAPPSPATKPAAPPAAPAAAAAPAVETKERKGLRGLFDRKPTVIRVVPDLTAEPAPPPPAPKPQVVAKPAPAPTPVVKTAPAPKPVAAPAPVAPPASPGVGPDSAIERYARQFLSKNGKPELPPADPETVRAAVTVALDAAMPALVDEITKRVLAALETSRTA